MPPKSPSSRKRDNPHSTSTESTQLGGATDHHLGGAMDRHLGGATDCGAATRTKVKKENDCEYTDGHSHHFTVKFSPTDNKKYQINCHQPRTVLKAIQSSAIYKEKMKCSDKNIAIQLGRKDCKYTVATHFPCSLIEDGECLIISCKSEQVEIAQDQCYETTYSSDRYSVFFIDKEGGKNTKSKTLFKNSALKQFKYLCVYGEKGDTVQEALKRDGRFIDDLGNFTLSDNEDPECNIDHTQYIDQLNKKEFKICFPRNKRASDEKQQENPGTSSNPQQKSGTRPVSMSDVAQQSGVSVRKAKNVNGSSVDIEEISERLREQFPALKELMQSRFPGDSYQKELELKKENFGKIQQSFSEVHRVRELLKLGESVCKVVIPNVCEGTGFVLFDNFILTNGHLFSKCVEGQSLQEGTEVFVLFNYDDPQPHLNYYYFKVAESYIYCVENELDYAVLELNPEGEKPNQKKGTKKVKVPPGLLKNFGPLPKDGEACIIGHPAGGVKKMDPTCIIEIKKRDQAAKDHLDKYEKYIFIMHSIANSIKNQGIETIMMGGTRAENTVTYNTFMYHGSSGSPVFDALGRVFGLHTGGFTYEVGNKKESVIEYAQSVLTIFEHFVRKMKEIGDEELLKRVEKEAGSNQHLKFPEEEMETD